MTLTRRDSLRVLGSGVAAAALWPRERLLAHAASKGVKFKVGVTDWNLKQEGKPAAVELAKKIGFDGVQISIGKGTDRLPLSDPAHQSGARKTFRKPGPAISTWSTSPLLGK